MRYHGNYCGPNWSDGKHQPSVIGGLPAIDEFDETCRVHDAAYATHSEGITVDLANADLNFARSNLGKGLKRSVAAAAVGAQGLIRAFDKYQHQLTTTDMNSKSNQRTKRNLRGAQQQQATTRATKSGTQAQVATVPASYGFTLTAKPPQVTRGANKSVMQGADFAGTVLVANTTYYQPACSALLNPVYFQNGMLGSLARTYEKFRFTKATVHYIPSVPTSTQGQLVMCSTRTVKEPFFDGSSTTFLSRALSQGNAVACPLWKEAILDVPCSGDWLIVDSLIDGDLDDSIQEEVQCYAYGEFGGVAGILMVHYTIEFKDPLYTYHPTQIPVSVGNGSYGTLTDNSAINAINDTVVLNNPTGFSFTTGGVGAVYRLVFRQEASTRPAGPVSWAALSAVQSNSGVNSTLVAASAIPIGLVTGTTLYGNWNGLAMALYSSYEGASQGATGDQLIYAAVTSSTGTWNFLASLVRLGPAFRITSQ